MLTQILISLLVDLADWHKRYADALISELLLDRVPGG
jgi:hypothetical protein